MEHKAGGVRSRLRLVCLLIRPFVAIGPIADGFDENPVLFVALRDGVESGPLHLAAQGLRKEGPQLVAELFIVYKLLAREHQSEMDMRRSRPIQNATSKSID